MKTSRAWLQAARPRTLPLALACVALGSFLAAFEGQFNVTILVLSVITTLFLQILSNLSNDYGDSVHGADHEGREGPLRAVQSGVISKKAMKTAIVLFTALSLLSGVALLIISFDSYSKAFLALLLLGVAAIWAAISYTAGSKPYGYAGLGDLFVVVFFGIVGVMGTYFLHTKSWHGSYILPALSCGLLATAVLNINNIRDIESDRKAGKRSIPVRIGKRNAVIYHWLLLGSSVACALIFVLLHYQSPFQLLFILTIPLLVKNGVDLGCAESAERTDPLLRQLAVSTLLFILVFGLGLVV